MFYLLHAINTIHVISPRTTISYTYTILVTSRRVGTVHYLLYPQCRAACATAFITGQLTSTGRLYLDLYRSTSTTVDAYADHVLHRLLVLQ